MYTCHCRELILEIPDCGILKIRAGKIPLIALALFGWAVISQGEEAGSSVYGEVRDSVGMPVAGASVTARNVTTGSHNETKSGPDGKFEMTDLVPGLYDIILLTSQQESEPGPTGRIELRAGNRKAVKLVLRVRTGLEGGDTGTLQGGAAGTGPALAPAMQQITASQLVGLPLNGRSYTQLATLQASVSDPSGASASRGIGGGGLTVSGGRPSSNNFLLDGVNVMDIDNRVPRSAAGVRLGSDSVLQVQVFSGNFGAEYGRGSGGVLNSVTRSGTPELHGTVFEYLRNSALDARNFFDPEQEPPPFKRNQFGFSLTGPIRKDQTYFFASFEGLRDRLSQTQVDHFPDEQARNGFPDENGNPTVPINPAVQPYLALYPLPNSTRLGNGIAENRETVFLPTNEVFFTTRIDHRISEKDSLFARYTFDDATSFDTDSSSLFRRESKSRRQYAILLGTHIFSLSALTTFRTGYTRPVSFDESAAEIDIPESLYFVPEAPKFGQILVPGLTALGPAPGLPSLKITNTFQWASDTLIQKRAHGIRFGVEVHRYRWDSDNEQLEGGEWDFNDLESFLRGGPSGTSVIATLAGSEKYHARRQTFLGLYFQDTYSVRPNLQLSLGLRYEYTSLVTERDNRSVYVPDPWRDQEVQIGPFLQHHCCPAKTRTESTGWGF